MNRSPSGTELQAPARIKRLHALRQRLATLVAVHCRMAHERVVRAGATGLPVVGRAGGEVFRRVGLCTAEQRATRLGCSHTTARVVMDEAIRELANDTAHRDVAEELAQALNLLDNAIHLLDHRKGAAESTLAHALRAVDGQGAGFESVAIAEREIQDMERQHDDHVEDVGRLRDRILREFDAMLARVTAESRQPTRGQRTVSR